MTVTPSDVKVKHEVEHDDSAAYLITIDEAEVRSKVELLRQMFPGVKAQDLHTVLQCNDEDINGAADMLLDDNHGVLQAEDPGREVEYGAKGEGLKRQTEDMVSLAIVHVPCLKLPPTFHPTVFGDLDCFNNVNI